MTDTKKAKRKIRQRRGAKLAIGINTALALFLMGVMIGMLNYLGYRHYYRFDLSRTKYYTLSDKTVDVLSSLTNQIDVIVFFQKDEVGFKDIENLLKEYLSISDKIHVEYVDPDRDLARAEAFVRKYEMTEPNGVVFGNGSRTKYVMGDTLYEYTFNTYNTDPSSFLFKGEQVFSSTIQEISQGKKPIVYFLGGHGEPGLDDFDPYKGYSSIAKVIRRDAVEVRSLVLGEASSVPEDCDALVVAGPQQKISQPELDLIRSYMNKNGKMMVLLDAGVRVGLEPLLESWSIQLEDDVVVDPHRTLTGKDLFITEYGDHPIGDSLKNLSSIFYGPRSVEPMARFQDASDVVDKPRVTSLAHCSSSGWAEMDAVERPFKYNPSRDRSGPVSVAVAVEKGSTRTLDLSIPLTRMVVLGDATFVSNGSLMGGNVNLFMSALNWLLERETLMAIAPKEITYVELVMNKRDLAFLFWSVVVGLPSVIGLLGGCVWLARRRY